MQVHGPGADIDTLCVGPSYVNREVMYLVHLLVFSAPSSFYTSNSVFYPHQEHFFFILHDILAQMEEVTELQPVPDAHVPVMKFKYDGISIDLLYASISLLVVPDVSGDYLCPPYELYNCFSQFIFNVGSLNSWGAAYAS